MEIDLVGHSAQRSIDTAILVTGDSDFVPAIKFAKNAGVQVRLYHGSTVHEKLSIAVDQRVKFDKPLIDKVLRASRAKAAKPAKAKKASKKIVKYMVDMQKKYKCAKMPMKH